MIGIPLGLGLVGAFMWLTYYLARVEPLDFEPHGIVRGTDNGSRCEWQDPYRGRIRTEEDLKVVIKALEG